ncbi:hypothetical protein [Heyndrickxia camelliae]|nr:hypothetical protein [Heyndrickxia camelliae]
MKKHENVTNEEYSTALYEEEDVNGENGQSPHNKVQSFDGEQLSDD